MKRDQREFGGWGVVAQQPASATASALSGYQRRCSQKATLTRLMSTGTSTMGPITAAKADPWAMPKVATATAMAN